MVLEEVTTSTSPTRRRAGGSTARTPRTAKRLAHRLLFTTAVATERYLRGPIPPRRPRSSASG